MVVYYKNMVLEGCPEEIVEMIKLYEHGFPIEAEFKTHHIDLNG